MTALNATSQLSSERKKLRTNWSNYDMINVTPEEKARFRELNRLRMKTYRDKKRVRKYSPHPTIRKNQSCPKCGMQFLCPDEELNQGVFCPECNTQVRGSNGCVQTENKGEK